MISNNIRKFLADKHQLLLGGGQETVNPTYFHNRSHIHTLPFFDSAKTSTPSCYSGAHTTQLLYVVGLIVSGNTWTLLPGMFGLSDIDIVCDILDS